MTPDAMLTANALKAWRFLYRRGFIEGFGHLSVRLDADRFVLIRHSLGRKADAGAKLFKTRGPFRRVWAMVEAEDEERDG